MLPRVVHFARIADKRQIFPQHKTKYKSRTFWLFASLLCRQEEDNHEQSSDVRSQLKFFEQLDQSEKQRKEEQEREILLKAAKVQSKVASTHPKHGR